VECPAGRVLGDLLTATEAIRDDEPVVGSLADGREQFEFASSAVIFMMAL